MEIRELPDYKATPYEVDKYIDEPLLEYVWEVANEFKPDCDEQGIYPSIAPIIFANRCIESKLTDNERYARYLEIYPHRDIDCAKNHYSEQRPLDSSFKDLFFGKEEVQDTLKAFNLDPCKFWYLLLFVNDLMVDVCINAPSRGTSELENVSNMVDKVLDATEIITKANGRQNYETQDPFILFIMKASLQHFITSYNNIIETSENYEECRVRLKEIGLNDIFKNRIAIISEDKVTLEKSHRTRVFATLFKYFLKSRTADREVLKKSRLKISTDKLLLISRLTHIVGLQGSDYYEAIINDKDNRKLSNLLNRYKDESLPPMTGRIYSGWF